jgi:hypothetical protein
MMIAHPCSAPAPISRRKVADRRSAPRPHAARRTSPPKSSSRDARRWTSSAGGVGAGAMGGQGGQQRSSRVSGAGRARVAAESGASESGSRWGSREDRWMGGSAAGGVRACDAAVGEEPGRGSVRAASTRGKVAMFAAGLEGRSGSAERGPTGVQYMPSHRTAAEMVAWIFGGELC